MAELTIKKGDREISYREIESVVRSYCLNLEIDPANVRIKRYTVEDGEIRVEIEERESK